MTLLTWDHACTVGVRAMDDQHGILMDATNELRLALVRGCGREKLCELLDRLIEYTRIHFCSEEQLMEKAGYAGLAEHRAKHRKMLADLMQTAHRLQYGGGGELRALLCELHNSYLQHIETSDQPYGPCLNARGIC